MQDVGGNALSAIGGAVITGIVTLWPKIAGGKARAEKALWDRLNAEVDRLADRCEALERRIEERDGVIDRLTNRVQELESENAELKRKIEQMRRSQAKGPANG